MIYDDQIEREERIAIVAEGCRISQKEAERKVQAMEREAILNGPWKGPTVEGMWIDENN